MRELSPSCVAVDWGTSRLRLWVLDGEGTILAVSRSDEGLEGVRQTGFAATLEAHLSELQIMPDIPVVICGMAGSRQGWLEAPYIQTPAPLSAIAAGARRVEGNARDIRILPGLSQNLVSNPQVMRGEETKLLGLALDKKRHLVCMPGTHSKWVDVSNGIVTGFTTFLTGELFALFCTQSILRHSVGDAAYFPVDHPSFVEACQSMIDAPQLLAQKLFSIRAAGLLFDQTPEHSAAALSGLLIGAEVGAAKLTFGMGTTLTLAATGQLGELYALATTLAGFDRSIVDSEVLVRAGLFNAARSFWPSRFDVRKSA